MTDLGKITQVVYSAIDELNDQLAPDERLVKSSSTVLFGNDGTLDSLGLVNLITITEQKVEDELGTSITLADERALSAEESPFKTVGSLSHYISGLLTQ